MNLLKVLTPFKRKKKQMQTCKNCGEKHEPEDDQGNPWFEYSCMKKEVNTMIVRKHY